MSSNSNIPFDYPKYNWKVIASTASFGVFGGALLTYALHHKKVSLYLLKRRIKTITSAEKNIKIINNSKEWDLIFPHFAREAKTIEAVGFDCEWIQIKGKRRPVALLQLATHSGLCILVRLNQMQKNIPLSLKQFLEDQNILKVGVGIDIDKKLLLQDHNFMVCGCVDLRHLELLQRERKNEASQIVQEKLGLQALARKYLDKIISKDWRVRTGDWEGTTLTKTQISYAADDALVGIHILLKLMAELFSPPRFLFISIYLLWHTSVKKILKEICSPFIDLPFRGQSSDISKKKAKITDVTKPSKLRSSYSTRKTPLYHNSQLLAPDGEPLSTCDPSKALWYVEKGLGELVSENPLIVQLNFEPAGRPNKEGADGQFYLQERLNVCVVCGKTDSYIRKNIIPREYRKYFPTILKSHQSHDVVLLCVECHQISNIKDNALRHKLGDECDAPIGCESDIKETTDGKLKVFRSAGRALIEAIDKLPPSRVTELENVLKNYYGTDTLSAQQVHDAANLDVKNLNEEYSPHGYKVYQTYKRRGLILFEKLWREWFLDSMNPSYMPDNWSVTHNFEKLKVKMTKYPLDHPIRNDYKEALVGTDGSIDVPYIPNGIGSKPIPEQYF